jgi:hypothetical protein
MKTLDSNLILIVTFHFLVSGIIIYIGLKGKEKEENKKINDTWYDVLLFLGLIAIIYNLKKLLMHLIY